MFGFLAFYLAATLRNAAPPNLAQVRQLWEMFGAAARLEVGNFALLMIFLGLWLGAASHTFTDIAGTFIKTGKVKDFL